MEEVWSKVCMEAGGAKCEKTPCFHTFTPSQRIREGAQAKVCTEEVWAKVRTEAGAK
jgi:hypothetical protein